MITTESGSIDKFFEEVNAEEAKQIAKWGNTFDDKNTVNDWTAYVCHYAGKASFATTREEWHENMIKAATLIKSALRAEARNNGLPPRHYDKPKS